jgi:Tol biopolymer transport system component
VKSDGSGSQQITNGVLLADAGNCDSSWSPDGTKIAFTGVTANIPYASRYNVYVMNTDGSNITELTNCIINSPYAVPSLCGYPSWSPDGTKIAFTDADTPYGDSLGGGGIYLMNPDGSGVTPVFQDNTANNLYPKWSSDGKRIFFSYMTSDWGVWSLNTDGTGMVEIIPTTNKYWPQGIDCSHCGRFDNL